MTTRIEDIILRARDTLADPNAERYSDARLLRLLSEGQQDLVVKARLLRRRCEILPIAGIAEYQLPSDVWLITRASFKGCKMKFATYDDMDNSLHYVSDYGAYSSNISFFDDWQNYTAVSPYAVIYDRLDQGIIRLYPIPNFDLVDSIFDFVGDLGTITELESYDVDPDISGSSFLEDEGFTSQYNALFGEIVSVTELPPPIVIQYFALAPALTSVNDMLQISTMYDKALKYYITGNALRDDLDTQSRQMGAEELALYQGELALAKAFSTKNFTSNADRQTQYTGPFSR